MFKKMIFVVTLFLTAPAFAEKTVPLSKEQISLSYAPVVKKTAPAVVNIYTKRVVKTRSGGFGLFFNDPFFNQFFGGLPDTGVIRSRVEQSLGSGVLVKEDGVVITNNHVVDGADEITIALNDKREFEAKIIGVDAKNDLAVLKIDNRGQKLPYLTFGDSDEIEIGDLVLAIGNPFGVGQTVTSGIISALARATGGVGDFRSYIQTDAAINPGNSGGALVTMDGKLIGIPTVILSRSGQNSGVGMATPANLIARTLEAILETGKIIRPWLGITGQSVSGDIALSLGLERATGVLVSDIHKASPSFSAGLKTGDIITKINGRIVEDVENMYYRVATSKIDDIIDVEVLRQGHIFNFKLKLIAPPDIPKRKVTELSGIFGGIKISNINPAVAFERELAFDAKGVIVVEAKGTRLGIIEGDIIEVINGVEIKDVNDLVSVAKKSVNSLAIRIRRGNRVFDIVVR